MTQTTNNTRPAPTTWSELVVGDVVEDSYGNPAVVLQTAPEWAVKMSEGTAGNRTVVIQTVGSDRGNLSSPGRIFRLVTGDRAEWAKNIARKEWQDRHNTAAWKIY